jgi:hypothetical protein
MNSRWAILKVYRKAAGKCPKAIGKPLGIFKGHRMPLGNRRGSRIAQWILERMGHISIPFLSNAAFLFTFI